MTNVDQFESVFRAADKPVFHNRRVELRSVLVVTDLEPGEASAFESRIRRFLKAAPGAEEAAYEHLAGVQVRSTGDLLQKVEALQPDLIIAYRNLFSDGWQWPHSLGESLDVLTQTATAPVMVVPHPQAGREAAHALDNTNRVMAITDHVAGDDRLVNWAVAMTEDGGKLWLSHVEDEATYERLIAVIAKIPAIDTETARETIRARLLRDAADYIQSVHDVLTKDGVALTVEPVVMMGHQLADHQKLVDDHDIDLLVLNTRDDDQLAMHGLAYPIAVELRHIPLLML